MVIIVAFILSRVAESRSKCSLTTVKESGSEIFSLLRLVFNNVEPLVIKYRYNNKYMQNITMCKKRLYITNYNL